MKNKRIKVGEHYRKGWSCKDAKRAEFYDTILNDLAEDICITNRITRENLIEVAGYLQRLNHEHNEKFQEMRQKLLIIWSEPLIRKELDK